MDVIAGRAASPPRVDHGPARARAVEAVVSCLRRHVGRGPDRARAAFLGDRTVTVELGRVLTTADRALTMAGRTDVVGAFWTQLGVAVGSEFAAAVGRALEAEATCTSWVIDVDADTLLLVFTLGEPTPPLTAAKRARPRWR